MASERDYNQFDILITNPPWEAIKPDRRELSKLSDAAYKKYLVELRNYDRCLAEKLPFSQPKRKFAGWGTNLSRCGVKLSLKLTKLGGLCGIVVPLSLLMDQMSSRLPHWMLDLSTPLFISHYPAETKLFDGVDTDVATLVLRKE